MQRTQTVYIVARSEIFGSHRFFLKTFDYIFLKFCGQILKIILHVTKKNLYILNTMVIRKKYLKYDAV